MYIKLFLRTEISYILQVEYFEMIFFYFYDSQNGIKHLYIWYTITIMLETKLLKENLMSNKADGRAGVGYWKNFF